VGPWRVYAMSFIILEGNIWEQLELLIRQKQVDIGGLRHTRPRRSRQAAPRLCSEQIFRHSIVLSRLWVQVLTRIPWSKN